MHKVFGKCIILTSFMNLIVIVPFPFVKLINIDSQAGLNVSLELDDQQARYSHQTFHLVEEKKALKLI